jgi:hypothetical protein
MQVLLLADDLMPSLKSGEKVCTIRSGKREIIQGNLFFKATDSGEYVKVYVTEVRHKTLGELTDEEAQMDGAADATEMAAALKRFYPDIDANSDITIVLYYLSI